MGQTADDTLLTGMTLEQLPSQIEARTRRGGSLWDIEELIAAAPVSREQKAALWLWAWTAVDRRRRGGKPRATWRCPAGRSALALVAVSATIVVLAVAVTASAATRTGGRGPQTLVGTAGADSLFGRGGADQLFGLAGSDRLDGGAGPDRISASAGDDRADGGPGADRIWGGAGNDELYGDAGADVLWGGPGADVLIGAGGHDRLAGGPGDDVIDAVDAAARDFADCGPGVDVAYVSAMTEIRNCEHLIRDVDVIAQGDPDTGGPFRQQCDDDDPTTTDYGEPRDRVMRALALPPDVPRPTDTMLRPFR